MKLLEALFSKLNELGLPSNYVIYTLIILIVSAPAIALTSFIISIFRLRNDNSNLNLNKIIADDNSAKLSIASIDKSLTSFYFPLRYYLIQSKMLYETFAIKEKKEARANGKRFSALRHLCDGKEFSKSDSAIFDQILKIGDKQNKIIEKNNWAVTDNALSELLSLYSAHLRTLKLANNKILYGMTDSLESYKFPITLPGAIESKIFQLTEKKESLQKEPESYSKYTKNEKRVVKHYNKKSKEYYDQTIRIDMTSEYDKFISKIKPGGLICDIGCGSGRDTKFFIENGFRVLSIEPSTHLAKLANAYEFSHVKNQTLLEMSYTNRFDAIWCCAVLQHIEPKNLQKSISRIAEMLRPNGIIYLSYRTSSSSNEPSRNTIFIHETSTIKEHLDNNNLEVIKNYSQISKKDNIHPFNTFILKKNN